MTSPDGPSPFAPPSAAGPGTPAPPPPPPHASPYAQPAPAPWSAPAPSRGPSPVLAIVALVVAGLALLVAVGTLVFALAMSGFFDSSYTLTGTAPQVVDGQPYSGALLATEVERVLRDDGSDVGPLTCPDTPRVDSDATTTCSGEVDGWQERLTVDFQDGEGHFVLTVEDAG
ncbi:MAG: DUF4333 domain-containing protein [Angustibacter sp.]